MVGLLVAWIVVPFVSHETLTVDRTSTFLLTTAAIGGTVLAIVFALSTVLQQGLFGLVPTTGFAPYVADWRQKLAFIVMVTVVLGLLGGSLMATGIDPESWASWQPRILGGGLVSMALVFGLARWQYMHVVRRLNPHLVIDALERDALKTLGWLADMVRDAADSISTSPEAARAAELKAWKRVPPEILAVPIGSLFELANRLADRSDALASRRALMKVANIVCRYLTERRRSSLALPAGNFGMAAQSDSQDLLAAVLEPLNTICIRYLTLRQLDCARTVVDAYAALLDNGAEMEFLGLSDSNPILAQVHGYFGAMVKSAIKEGDAEVAFRSIELLERVGAKAIANGHTMTLTMTQSQLGDIAALSWTPDRAVLVERCVEVHCHLIRLLLRAKRIATEFHFRDVLRRLRDTHSMALRFGAVTPGQNGILFALLRKPFELQAAAFHEFLRTYQAADEEERKALEANAGDYLKSLSTELRRTVEAEVTVDSSYVDAIGHLVDVVASAVLMIQALDGTGRARSRLNDGLRWLLHVPSWYAHDRPVKDGDSRGIRTLVEELTTPALVSLLNNEPDDLVLAALKTQMALVRRALKAGGFGHGEPRAMAEVCLSGILARKLDRRMVLREVLALVAEFDGLYEERYRGLSGFSLQKALLEFRDELETGQAAAPFATHARALAAAHLTLQDVDTFLAVAWPDEVRHDSPDE